METFDPYRKWLGIPPEEQPPNHYRLLGVGPFESDSDVISHAADRQMVHVRSFQSGEHAELSQRILNELSAARVCLLETRRKAQYDAQLRRQMTAGTPTPPEAAPPPQPPPGGSAPPPQPPPGGSAPPPQPPLGSAAPPVSAPAAVPQVATGRRALFRMSRSRGYLVRRNSSWWASAIALAITLVSLALLAWVLSE